MKKIIIGTLLLGLNTIPFLLNAQQKWTLSGNTVAQNGSDFLGTLNNQPLVFKVGGQTGMSLVSGNAPTLDISGNLSLSGTHMLFNSLDANMYWGGANGGDLKFYHLPQQGNYQFLQFPIMTMKPDGNVGIGTVTPGARLEVAVKNAADMACIYRYGPNSQNLFFVPYVPQGGYNPISQAGDMGIFWNDQMNTFDNSNAKAGLVIAPKHSTENGIRINSRGQVGIGTNNMAGNYRLYVKDGILTEKIKVAVEPSLDWGDYVFEKTYKRMSFAAQRKFYEKHHHLKGVPSAKDIIKDGIDVTEMFTSVVVNLEEARLDVLDLHGDQEKLKVENQELKTALNLMQKEISQLKKQISSLQKN